MKHQSPESIPSDRPFSAINFDLAMTTLTREIKQKDLAERLHCDPAQISRLRKFKAMAPREAEKLAKILGFEEHGLSPWIFDYEPSHFRRELVRVGFGKYLALNRMEAFLGTFRVVPGTFLPEDALARLLIADGPNRNFGVDDDGGETPSAIAVIGQRYGLALEVESRELVRAIQGHQAMVLLLHRDRARDELRIAEWSDRCIAALPESVYGRRPPKDPDDIEVEGRPTALIAPRLDHHDGHFGYPVLGAPGRRDIYVFLFARKPNIGTEWRDAQKDQVVTPDMARRLMISIQGIEGVGDREGHLGIQAGHVVYDAIPR